MNDIYKSYTGKLVWVSRSGKFKMYENAKNDIVQVAGLFPPEGGFVGTKNLYVKEIFLYSLF